MVPSDIITEKLLRDGKLKQTETEVDDALESRFHLSDVSLCVFALWQGYFLCLNSASITRVKYPCNIKGCKTLRKFLFGKMFDFL